MRVLHVSHQYYPAIGGAERYITDLSEELAARGHTVDVFTTRSRDYTTWVNALPPRATVNGVRVRRFRSLPRTRLAWQALALGMAANHRRRGEAGVRAWHEPLIFCGNGPLSPGLAAALWRRVQSYDLVHITSLHYAHAWVAYRVAAGRGTPVVMTPLIHIGQPETFDVGYMRRMLQGSEAVFAVSEAERRLLLAQKLSRDAVTTGVGLRLERFPPLEQAAARARLGLPLDAFVVLFLGRKTAYKGLPLLLDAIAALRRQRPDAVFLAVGPETDFSHGLWAERGTQPGVVVRGEVAEQERLDALAACDVLALPSRGESFGIVFLEAWAYGKPVIGADIEAVASLIDDGVDGFLVDTDHPGDLSRRLAQLAAQPELGRRLGEAGRRKLQQRYTLGAIADIVEGTYARVRRRHATRKGQPLCAST